VTRSAEGAALAAGYAPENAVAVGDLLLRNPLVCAAIEEEIDHRAKSAYVTASRVLVELAIVGQSSLEDYVLTEDGRVVLAPGAPREAMRAVSSVERKVTVTTDDLGNERRVVDTKIRLWDKTRALELLAKHLGMLIERFRIDDPNATLARLLGIDPSRLPPSLLQAALPPAPTTDAEYVEVVQSAPTSDADRGDAP
jgi:phage terminase small subunit